MHSSRNAISLNFYAGLIWPCPQRKQLNSFRVPLANLQDLYLNSSANSSFSLPSYSTPTSSSTKSMSSYTVFFWHSVTVSKIWNKKWNLRNKYPPLSSAILNCEVIWHWHWGCKSGVTLGEARCEWQDSGSCRACVIQNVFLYHSQFAQVIHIGL